jgi:hypothetical protein
MHFAPLRPVVGGAVVTFACHLGLSQRRWGLGRTWYLVLLLGPHVFISCSVMLQHAALQQIHCISIWSGSFVQSLFWSHLDRSAELLV